MPLKFFRLASRAVSGWESIWKKYDGAFMKNHSFA